MSNVPAKLKILRIRIKILLLQNAPTLMTLNKRYSANSMLARIYIRGETHFCKSSLRALVNELNEEEKPQNHLKPHMASWLSKFILEDYAIGDLDELHADWLEAFGQRKADLLYWKNILVSIWPIAKTKMISALKAVGLYEVIRQLLF